MSIIQRDLDSRTYRKLFEFIKREGAEPVIDFLIDYASISEKSLIYDALCEGRHHTLSLVKRNKMVVDFIRELNTRHLPCFLSDRNFLGFIGTLSSSDIDSQIEGARCLEELGVHSVNFGLDSTGKTYTTYMHYDDNNVITNIVKYYSNGIISYGEKQSDYPDWDKYSTDIKFLSNSGNFVLSFDNLGFSEHRDAYITDFGFDTSLLPCESELLSLAPPKTLTSSNVYVKKR